jgi:hypothetical protein
LFRIFGPTSQETQPRPEFTQGAALLRQTPNSERRTPNGLDFGGCLA